MFRTEGVWDDEVKEVLKEKQVVTWGYTGTYFTSREQGPYTHIHRLFDDSQNRQVTVCSTQVGRCIGVLYLERELLPYYPPFIL